MKRSTLVSGRKTASEVICENVGLQSQTIFQDYRCTYKASISYFGRLYLGEEHVIFVSSMFGFVKKIAIPIDSISALKEPEQGSLLITGLRLDKNTEEDFAFSGFSNNHPFKIIRALWKREKLSAELMRNSEEEAVQEEDKLAAAFDGAELEIKQFKEAGADNQHVKMLEIVFPCSVEQFYDFFLADEALLYGRRQHLETRKAHTIVVSPWKKNEELQAETREISAVIKVKGVPLMSEARMNQVWLLTRDERYGRGDAGKS
jgi:hypothetical protein